MGMTRRTVAWTVAWSVSVEQDVTVITKAQCCIAGFDTQLCLDVIGRPRVEQYCGQRTKCYNV
jgi:hypothetical protein